MVRPSDSAPAPVSSSTLSALVRKHRVPGAQLAVHRDGVTTAVEVGALVHGQGEPAGPAAAFPLGSITKCFTATTAMVLVADGELKLDEPLADHLPELEHLDADLTLRHLLSHTGGWASGPDFADGTTVSMRRYVADHCRRHNLLVPPGTAFSYSNLGYVLVGRLIEALTGMSWREATESIVLRPLGIEPGFVTVAGFPPSTRPIAAGHSVNHAVGRVRPVPQSLPLAEAPTGALALSATDLIRLALLHLGAGRPDLLAPEDAAHMREPVPGAEPFGLADGWGLGLAIFRSGGTTWVGHDGNAHGTSCYLRICADNGWAVALTSNANTGAEMWAELVDELATAGILLPRPPVASVSRPPATPPDAAGTYRNGDVEYVVLAADGRLLLSVDGDAATPLSCGHDLAFALRDPDTGRQVLGGRFVRDPGTGGIDALQLGGRLARRHHADRSAVRGRRTA